MNESILDTRAMLLVEATMTSPFSIPTQVLLLWDVFFDPARFAIEKGYEGRVTSAAQRRSVVWAAPTSSAVVYRTSEAGSVAPSEFFWIYVPANQLLDGEKPLNSSIFKRENIPPLAITRMFEPEEPFLE